MAKKEKKKGRNFETNIGKEWFDFSITRKTEAEAITTKKNLKKKGFRVRIIKVEGGYKIYKRIREIECHSCGEYIPEKEAKYFKETDEFLCPVCLKSHIYESKKAKKYLKKK